MEGKITAQETLEADKIVQGFKDIDAAALKTLQTFSEIQKIGNVFKTQGQGADVIRRNNTAQEQGLEIVKQREKLERSLQAAIAKKNLAFSSSNIELQKNRAETNLSNKAIRDQVALSSQLVGAYKRLSIEHAKARKTLKDYVAEGKRSNETQKQFNARLKTAQFEFDRLDKRIIKADTSARQFNRNVGNYPKNIGAAVSSLRSLAGALGVTIGLTAIADFARDSIALAREAKGVEFAFKALGEEGVSAFENIKNSSRGLLSDLNIQRSLVELDNFNISLEETDTLMEFLLVRAAQTGRSVDSLRDSLVEGLSKESKLRIDNLGISTAELNSELEKTPNFVEAVANIAKREVAEAGTILDEAANSSEAFNASWENLTLSFGKAFNAFKGSSTVISVLDAMTQQQQALNSQVESGIGYFERLKTSFNILTESGRAENKRIIEETELRKENAKAVQQQINSYVALNGALAPFKNGLSGSGGNDVPFPFRVPEETPRLLADINDELEKANNELKEGAFSSREEASVIQDRIKDLEKERDAILGSSKSRDEARTIINGSVAAYQKIIKELKEEQSTLATTNESYTEYQKQIEEAELKVIRLTRALDSLNKVENAQSFRFAGDEDEITAISADTEGLAEAQARAIIRQEAQKEEVLKAIREGGLEDYKHLLDEEVEAVEDAIKLQTELRKNLTEDVKNLAFDAADGITEARIQNVEKEIDANDERFKNFESLLIKEGASEEKLQLAKEEYERQDKALQEKKEKREKQAFLIKQGLALADVAINLASTITAINLAAAELDAISFGVGGSAYKAINIPLAIGSAALQTGSILAQSIPAFFKGKEEGNNYEGLATWNERRPEVMVDKEGNVQFGKTKNELIYVSPEDIISPSYQDFGRDMEDPTSSIYKRVNKTLARESMQRTQMMVVNNTPEIDMSEIKKLNRNFEKYSKRPIQNHVTIQDKRRKV